MKCLYLRLKISREKQLVRAVSRGEIGANVKLSYILYIVMPLLVDVINEEG